MSELHSFELCSLLSTELFSFLFGRPWCFEGPHRVRTLIFHFLLFRGLVDALRARSFFGFPGSLRATFYPCFSNGNVREKARGGRFWEVLTSASTAFFCAWRTA